SVAPLGLGWIINQLDDPNSSDTIVFHRFFVGRVNSRLQFVDFECYNTLTDETIKMPKRQLRLRRIFVWK
ncbi:MAG: hypothetical protein IKO93_04650, partial [Lentisphaeria bacterium]|nr:hypothetical protein [Lentisphaeria bacterium]